MLEHTAAPEAADTGNLYLMQMQQVAGDSSATMAVICCSGVEGNAQHLQRAAVVQVCKPRAGMRLSFLRLSCFGCHTPACYM